MTAVPATSVAAAEQLGPPASDRIKPADGVRGLAALAIVVHHVSFATGRTYDGDLVAAVNARLDVGVAVFFVLSGYLLFEPYARRIVDGEGLPDRRRFWRRRITRVFPAYWVALLIQLALGLIAVKGIVGFALNVTLTQIYVEDYVLTGIIQSWTVATEIGFYLLLPFVATYGAHLARGRTASQRMVLLWAICLAGVAISSLSRLLIAGLDLPGTAIYRYTVFANADYFAGGMALAVLMVGARRAPRFAELQSRMFRRPGWWYAGAAFAMWLAATQLDVPLGLSTASTDVEIARHAAYFVVAVLVVAPACCSTDPTTWSARFLGSRPLVFLGMVSYGLYLWHQIFLHQAPPGEGWIFQWTGWPPFDAPFLQVFVLVAAGGIALGTISWYVVERPLLRRFK